MTESIAGHVAQALDGFRQLLSYHDSPNRSPHEQETLLKLDDELPRFKVWSANIGAHRTGRSSLEYRLRDASHLRLQLLKLLSNLVGSLGELNDILSGNRLPWDRLPEDDQFADSGSDPGPKTELEQIKDDIAEVVDCLLRLSVSLRNPAPHDRFFKSKQTDTSWYEQFDIPHVQNKFPGAEDYLSTRLGKAISLRRQWFKYREAHHLRIAQGLDSDALDDKSTVASSIPQYAKNFRGSLGMPGAGLVEETFSDTCGSQTSYATSTADGTGPRIPPRPLVADKGPFECPFCHMMIEATTKISWKYVLQT